MRVLAVGDIHGCLTALEALAAFVPFRDDDLIITLGDVVNRGPNTRGVIDWLIARDAAGTLVPLRGNHEVMMLAARETLFSLESWLNCGGRATLRSYSEDPFEKLSDVPESHWQFLESTRRIHEIETHFFVHAGVQYDLPLDEQFDDVLFWERFHKPRPHESGKIMVCGHTSQRSGVPRNLGHAICIDTWAYGDGWLTCLDVSTNRYWQANRAGETRTGITEPEE